MKGSEVHGEAVWATLGDTAYHRVSVDHWGAFCREWDEVGGILSSWAARAGKLTPCRRCFAGDTQ